MDSGPVENTVSKDALSKDISDQHHASPLAREINSTEEINEKTSSENEGKIPQDANDLLEKIEEIVNDQINSDTVESVTSHSSEHELIKKIEEMENETNIEKECENQDLKKNVLEIDESDRVILGKLIMEVSSEEKSLKVDINGESCSEDLHLSSIDDTDKSRISEKKIVTVLGERKDKLEKSTEDVDEISKESDLNLITKSPTERNIDIVLPASVEQEKITKSLIESSAAKTQEIKTTSELKEDVIDLTEETSEVIEEVEHREETEKMQEEKIFVPIENLQKIPTEDLTSKEEVFQVEGKQETKSKNTSSSGNYLFDSQKIENENTEKEEAMSVESTNPVIEPMEIDSEEKMEIDNENVVEIDDEDMKSISEKELEVAHTTSMEVAHRRRNEVVEAPSEIKEIPDYTHKVKNLEIVELEVGGKSLQRNPTQAKENAVDSVDKKSEDKQLIVPTSPVSENTVLSSEFVKEKEVDKSHEQLHPSEKSDSKSKGIELDVQDVEISGSIQLENESDTVEKGFKISAHVVDDELEESDSHAVDLNKQKTHEVIKDIEITEVKESGSSDSTASFISTTSADIIKFGRETTLSNVEVECDSHSLKKIENKPLSNVMKYTGSSSLDTTPVTTANVFNSTPIQKQFEISSENVSKISEGTETSRTEKVEDDPVITTSTDHQSSTDQHSSEHKSDQQSSDGISTYVSNIKKLNGMTDLDDEEEEHVVRVKGPLASDFSLLPSLSSSELKTDSFYDVNVWYDKHDISFFSIEKIELKKIGAVRHDKANVDGSGHTTSSNGSVTSLPMFSLPPARPSEVTSSLSSSQKTLSTGGKSSTSQIEKKKFKIQGIEQLCNIMIGEFTKIKKILGSDEVSKSLEIEPTTPKSKNKELTKKNLVKGKSISPSMSGELTPSPATTKTDKRSRKRSLQKSPNEEEDECKPKPKQSRKSLSESHETPSKEIESSQSDFAGQCVLAKWIDKKFYAGKITVEKPGNKFAVLFEDGATKILPRDSIVFGEGELLPLKDRFVHALVDDDYECGVVLSIDKVDNKIVYTVKGETKTVKVTASDLYLQVDQAKAIQSVQNAQMKCATSTTITSEEINSTASGGGGGGGRSTRNKRTSTSPVTPEPSYSGGVGKKGAKRQKRYS